MNNRISQEVLHARRPTLNYISPAICEAVFSGSSFQAVVLDALTSLPPITGLRAEYDPITGRFRISWDAYPFIQCYNVYKANDPAQPNGTYTLFISCTTETTFTTTHCPDCFLITAVTLTGETPFAGPICTTCPPPPPVPPDEPPIVFYNAEYTANCPPEFCGNSVTIPAGTYTSLFSQTNADAQAIEAANAALTCVPCILGPEEYLNYTNVGPVYEHPTAAHLIEHSNGGKHGQIMIVNRDPVRNIGRIRVEMMQGNPPVPTVYVEYSNPGFSPGTRASVGWVLYEYPSGGNVFWPLTNFKVRYSFATDPNPSSDLSREVAEIQSFSFDGQTITFYIGGLPPCICP